MQINNQFSTNQLQSTDRPLELKQGELYKAQIKERVSDTEAVIQIRGKEVKATFEGQVPSEDRVTVQVTGQKDQAVTVKTVSLDVAKSSLPQTQAQLVSDAKFLQSVGITEKDIPELKQGVQTLLDKGLPVTKEAVQELRNFFEKAQGSMAAKLDTVKALANKNLEVTQSHIRPIHEALHGRPINEVLTDLAKEIDPEFDLAKNEQKDTVRRQGQQNADHSQKRTGEHTSKTVKTEGATAATSVSITKQEQTKTRNTASTTSITSSEQSKTVEVLKDKQLVDLLQRNRDFVEKAPQLKQAIERVRSEIVKNPSVDRELAQKVEKAANEAEKLQTIGKERLVQALKNAEDHLIKKEQQRQENARVTVNQNKGAEGASLREATPSEIVKTVKEVVAKAPSLQRSIETVQKQIVDNSKIPTELANKLKQAVEEAGRLQQQGRITAGKETLVNALNSVEAELEVVESYGKEQQQVKQSESHVSKITQSQVEHRAQEPRMSEVVKQLKEEVQRNTNIQRVVEKVREQVVNNPKIDVEVARKVDKAVNEARQLQQIDRENMGRERLAQALVRAENELKQIETRQPQQPVKADQSQSDVKTKAEVQTNEYRSNDAKVGQTTQQQSQPAQRTNEQLATDTLKQAKEEVQREPNLQRVIEKVREQVVNNPKVDVEVAQKVEKAVNEARQLQQIGRENMGRERLVQALEQAENELKQIETRQQPQPENADQPQSDVKTKAGVQTDEVSSNEEKVGQTQQQSQPAQRTNEQSASETVKQVKEEVQREPNFQRAIEKVREQVVNIPKVDVEITQKVEKAVNEARQLQQIGRENTGRERLVQALSQVENELKQIETRQQQPIKADQSQSDVKIKAEVQTNEHRSNDAKVVQTTQQQSQPAQRANEQPASETVKQAKEAVQRDPNLQRAIEKVREQVVNNPKVDVEVAQKVEKAVNEARQFQQIGRESMGRDHLNKALAQAENELKQIELSLKQQPKVEQPASEAIKQVKEEVQREPNLQRAIEKVRDQVINNPKVDVNVARKVEKAVNEARQLQQMGRETMGRERLVQALEQAESEQKQLESHQQQQSKVGPINQQQQDNPDATEQRAIETIKQIKEAVQSAPNIQRAINEVRNLLKNNKDIDPKIINTIERMTNQASQLDQAGRERISKILDQAVDQLKQTATATAENAKTQSQIQPGENSTKIKFEDQQSQQKAKTQLENNQKLSQILANLLNQESTKAETENSSPSAQLKEALKQIQKESNLNQALNQLRKDLLSNPNLDMKTIEKVEKAINHSTQLLEKGRELGARQQITNTLTEIEQEYTKTESKQQVKMVDQQNQQQKEIQNELQKHFDQNEDFQTLPLESKNILVTKVTQKLAQATHDFRELKREITKNLDTVERLINTFKKNSFPQAKQMLETTISKLDNAILKSDMMLFTDMKTEKQLMQASSQLADAKKLLAKGNHTEAAKIVHDIKTLLDKINFKPSEQKVMHFVSKETKNPEQIQKSPIHQLLNQFDETARSYVRQEPSARQMFEMVRSLGLNHDSDLAKSLVFQKGGESPFQQGQGQQEQQNQQQQENLKAVLMKLTQTGGDEGSTRIAQQAEQALNNLTGQQLLSKADSGNTLQSMFFNLPLLLGEKPENLQVFVNSKKEGQQVDWENCNLYFLIETKKLGDVGIMLTSNDRNLSITIKNDKPGFKQKMEPIAAITKEKLQEVGYSINSINFTRMTAHNSQTAQSKRPDGINTQEHQEQMKPVFTEKGMDFKI